MFEVKIIRNTVALAILTVALCSLDVRSQPLDICGRDLSGAHRYGEDARDESRPTGGIPDMGTIGFQPYVAYPTGSWPEVVAIGDVNADGLNDVVLGTSFYFSPRYDYKIFVFLQNAQSGLNDPVLYEGGDIRAIDVGDLNHDSRLDVAIGFADSLGILYQNSQGTLNPMVTYYSGNSVDGLKTGDLNHDGLRDVAVCHWNGNFIRVFLQTPGGSFTSTTYAIPSGGYDEIDVGDVTGDNLDDVVFMRGQGYANENIAVFEQSPSGTLLPPVFYDLGNVNTNGVALGDVNHDGREDVVVTYGGNSPNAHIAVWLQNEGGALQDPPVSYLCYDIPEPVEIADFDLDGLKDVVVANGGWNAVSVYQQNDVGTLNPYQTFPIPYASHYQPQGLTAGDINSDGFPDLAIADYNHGLVVLINASTSAPTLTVTPTPVNPPIIIPASGGSFDFNATLVNNGISATSLDVWIMVRLPDQTWYGPELGPLNLTLPAGGSLTRLRTQGVPVSAPSGDYWYEARLGDYPTAVWDTSGFVFTKSATGDGRWVGEWSNSGQPWQNSTKAEAPDRLFLSASHPNPFNPSTTLSFTLLVAEVTSLKVFNVSGREVATLVDGWREAGTHEVTFDGSNLPSGVYIYRLQAGGFAASGKMVLMK